MFSVVELSQTCDSNPDCKAFTVWGSSSHSSISYVQGCLKDSATVEMGNSGCMYIRIFTPPSPPLRPPQPMPPSSPPRPPPLPPTTCPDIGGYSSEINVDHEGDDIACKPGLAMSPAELSWKCSRYRTCISFSLFGDNLKDSCIKNVSGPTRPVDGPTCYYTSLCEYEALYIIYAM